MKISKRLSPKWNGYRSARFRFENVSAYDYARQQWGPDHQSDCGHVATRHGIVGVMQSRFPGTATGEGYSVTLALRFGLNGLIYQRLYRFENCECLPQRIVTLARWFARDITKGGNDDE